MSTANVNSITAVREFKAALITFADEAASALEMMNYQVHRGLDEIEHERPGYWQKHIKLAFDEVAQTRTALSTCLLRTVAGHRPSCIEEKQAHAAAKQRLDYCQQMVPKVKAWAVKFRKESDEFRGRMGQLTRVVDTDLPRMIALIERTATALEQYADIAPVPIDEPTNSEETA